MKHSIPMLLVSFLTSVLADNFALAESYLHGAIPLEEVVRLYDTSAAANSSFVSRSNSYWEKQVPDSLIGPREFLLLADSLLENTGRGSFELLPILGAMARVTDGWVSEVFSERIRRYCDRYPENFKKAIVSHNAHNFILSSYLFAVYPDWCGSTLYRHNSILNDSLLKLTPQYLLLENDSCLSAIHHE